MNLSKEENDVVFKIKLYLNKIKDEKSESIKCLNIINLMNYLLTQKKFLEKHDKFKSTVILKIKDLNNQLDKIKLDSIIEKYKQVTNKLLAEIE